MKGDTTKPDQDGAQPKRPMAAAKGDHNEADHVEHDACDQIERVGKLVTNNNGNSVQGCAAAMRVVAWGAQASGACLALCAADALLWRDTGTSAQALMRDEVVIANLRWKLSWLTPHASEWRRRQPHRKPCMSRCCAYDAASSRGAPTMDVYRGPARSSTKPMGTGPMLSAKMPSVHSSARPPSWALHPSILPFLMISAAVRVLNQLDGSSSNNLKCGRTRV